MGVRAVFRLASCTPAARLRAPSEAQRGSALQGEVRFLPSGGDTETQKERLAERLFLKLGDSTTAQMVRLL